MGPLTLGLTKLMQVCQWLLAAPEHILHQPLHLTEFAEGVLAATGGLETAGQLLPHGGRPVAFRYTPFLTILFL